MKQIQKTMFVEEIEAPLQSWNGDAEKAYCVGSEYDVCTEYLAAQFAVKAFFDAEGVDLSARTFIQDQYNKCPPKVYFVDGVIALVQVRLASACADRSSGDIRIKLASENAEKVDNLAQKVLALHKVLKKVQ